MPKEIQKSSRINVALKSETHMAVASVARFLGLDIQSAVEKAAQDWISKHAARARKKADQVLTPA